MNPRIVVRIFLLFLAIGLWLPNSGFGVPVFSRAVTNGAINIPGLVEASGIAASRNNPGVLWVENDSGNPAVVYAIDSLGRLLGTYVLPGNIDNEDIGIGPGPMTNVSYLYVADIGDNNADRTNILLYQIPEPAVYAWQTNSPFASRPLKAARTIALTYPDGARDAEAGFVDPVTGDWFVLSKANTSRIYVAPKTSLDTTNNKITMAFVDTLAFKMPNGADISPLGNELLVRQENFAQVFTRTNGQSISSAFNEPSNGIPVTGTTGGEPNGEAIGFDNFGSGYFTVSDNAAMGMQPLRYFARASFDGPTPPRILVPMAATWKFLANGSDQGAAWRNPGFNDSSWSNGAAQLGYGDGDEQTTVGYGASPNNKYITTYFRKTFLVTNASHLADATLKVVAVDGANIFLNGAPVANLNLSSNAAYNTLAAPMPESRRDTWQSFAMNPGVLAEGTNLFAAEVHLAAVTSNSLSFDLQLIATEAPFISAINLTNQHARMTLSGSSNSPTVIRATGDFLSWTNLGTVLLTNGSGIFSNAVTNSSSRFYQPYRPVP